MADKGTEKASGVSAKKRRYERLRLILGDQLNASHSWFKEQNDDVLYVIAELHQETGYVLHHVQKVCAFFLAMENFSQALTKAGHHVLHLSLDETSAYKNLSDLLESLCAKYRVEEFEYQRPDEYRLAAQLGKVYKRMPEVNVTQSETEHFLLLYSELEDYVGAGKHNRMESFYRKLRQRFDVLMVKGEPIGDKWNYDHDNRESFSADDISQVPKPKCFENDASAVLKRLERHNVKTFGKPEQALIWPVTRRQAQSLLTHFVKYCLPNFGRFQDAMTMQGDDRWSLYHSRLSFAINSKILHPWQVIQKVVKAYEDDACDIAQAEGFIRQIVGWREYVRAVYWVNMPEYASVNKLNANNSLPSFFWDGDTKMNCMRECVGQSLEYAYAHHIQRLMVIGNFCVLAGIDPSEVDAWYLGVYIDAIEWVELPNTRGMSQFADGGWVATKPYVSSGNYIHKMSDYCKSCHYSVKQKTGEDACPFNSLYWAFLERHASRFEKNPRMSMMYKQWSKRDANERQDVLTRADHLRKNLDDL